MPYVCVPPTITKIREENREQQARLKKWQTELARYPHLCPQLSGPIAELQRILRQLYQQLHVQEELIQQRIALQTNLIYSTEAPRASLLTNATAPTIVRTSIYPNPIFEKQDPQ